MNLTGIRKFIIVLSELLIFLVLAILVIINEIESPTAVIASIGGALTAIAVPFVTGNIAENKAEKRAQVEQSKIYNQVKNG